MAGAGTGVGETRRTSVHVEEAVSFLQKKYSAVPEVALILGSGLGVLGDEVEESMGLAYKDIPHFPMSTVEGHEGKLIYGQLEGKAVLVMQGRFHLYEGYDGDAVTFPVRVMRALGVKMLVVTNAAGGVNLDYKPGDLMLVRDHLNLMFRNPLIGPNDEKLGPRFSDMSEGYSRRLRALAREAAAEQGVKLQEGVYCGVLGPSYETPAEIRMIRLLGGDAVGMSTVPEVIAARHAGIEVLGISCISNAAAGILDQPLSHQEVMETAEMVKETFLKLVRAIVARLG